MASIYNPNQQLLQTRNAQAGRQNAAGTNVSNAVANTSPDTAMTRSTQQNQQQKAIQKMPSYNGFNSNYNAQLTSLLNQVMNRDKFQYDINNDMLYQQAKDQYVLNGRRAMQDTIGQASAMTGGYGNSYAASAGNQAYQQWLTQLAGIAPEYYDRALSAYQAEGDRLNNQYSMLANQDQIDYGRYQDAMSNANTIAMNLLSQGQMPSANLLKTAGISEADAMSFIRAWNVAHPQPAASSGGSPGKKTGDDQKTTQDQIVLDTVSGASTSLTPEQYTQMMLQYYGYGNVAGRK